jgi:hypothetical protein
MRLEAGTLGQDSPTAIQARRAQPEHAGPALPPLRGLPPLPPLPPFGFAAAASGLAFWRAARVRVEVRVGPGAGAACGRRTGARRRGTGSGGPCSQHAARSMYRGSDAGGSCQRTLGVGGNGEARTSGGLKARMSGVTER